MTPSIAVVGGGFGGVGAAVMLRRAGYDDVTVFERGERVGGVWHHNTYPGRRVRRPVAPLRVLVRAEPALVAPLRAAGRDPGLPRGRRAAPRGARSDPHRHRGDSARAGTPSARKWVLETSAGPHEADVLLTACGQLSVPTVPPIPGLDSFDGPAFHTAEWRHDVDLAGKRVAVVGTGCSAIQVVPAIQPIVEHVDVYQRSPGWTIPKMDFAYKERTQRLFERFPVAPAAGPRRDLRLHGAGRGRDDPPPLAAAAVPRGRAAGRSPRRSTTPSCAQGDAARRDRLQADHAHRRVVSDADAARTSSSSPTGSPRSRRAGSAPSDGTERPADVLVLATGFKSPRLRRADGDRRRRRPHARPRSGPRCRARTSG